MTSNQHLDCSLARLLSTKRLKWRPISLWIGVALAIISCSDIILKSHSSPQSTSPLSWMTQVASMSGKSNDNPLNGIMKLILRDN